MKSHLKLNIGNKQLTIEVEGDTKATIKALAFWCGLPTRCGACDSNEIYLNYKNPHNNDYYGLKCSACSAEYNFGQNKTGGTLFMKREPWKVWQGEPETNADES